MNVGGNQEDSGCLNALRVWRIPACSRFSEYLLSKNVQNKEKEWKKMRLWTHHPNSILSVIFVLIVFPFESNWTLNKLRSFRKQRPNHNELPKRTRAARTPELLLTLPLAPKSLRDLCGQKRKVSSTANEVAFWANPIILENRNWRSGR